MHVITMSHSTQHSVYYHTAAVVYSSIVNCSKIMIRPHGMIQGTSGHVSRWTNTKCKIQNTKVLPHMCESNGTAPNSQLTTSYSTTDMESAHQYFCCAEHVACATLFVLWVS
ncbi:unnamed protein product [Pylaiella littoralis]